MKIKIQGRNVENNKNTGTSKWVLPSCYVETLAVVFSLDDLNDHRFWNLELSSCVGSLVGP